MVTQQGANTEKMNNHCTIAPLSLNMPDNGVVNALTVDVEDWYQSTYDLTAPVPKRVVDNTQNLLALFDECGVRATFFILGLVCEKYPHLIADIKARGHELATHGYSHQPVSDMSRQEFSEDLKQSIDLLEDVTGEQVYGYRAPDFSVNTSSLWAMEVMIEHGIRYDSSIFPIRNPRYGIQGWHRFPHRIVFDEEKAIIEFPLSTLRLGGYVLPFVGGGYSRLLPCQLIELGIRRLNQMRRCAIIYLHPYEINADEMFELKNGVPFSLRLSQGFNRKTIPSKMRRLFQGFQFSTIREVLGLQ
jgi:polysaccharide deacetylase family protein (PEP-CTERM system associated)